MKFTCSKRLCTTLTRARAARAICVALPVSTNGSSTNATVRPRQHAQVRHRRKDVLAYRVLHLDNRVLLAAPGDHELRAPVHPPPDQPVPQRRLVEPGRVLHRHAPVRPRDEIRADLDHASNSPASASTAARNGSTAGARLRADLPGA